MRNSTGHSSDSGSSNTNGSLISGSSSNSLNLSGTNASPFPIFGTYIGSNNFHASNTVYNSSTSTTSNGQVSTPKNYFLMDNINRRYSYGSSSRRNSSTSVRSESDEEGLEDNVMFLHRMLIQNNGQVRQTTASGQRHSNRHSVHTLTQQHPKISTQPTMQQSTDDAQKEQEREEEVVRGTCRICFETDNVENFVSPCKCKGTQQYVHLRCLQLWQKHAMMMSIMSNNGSNHKSTSRAYRCSVCNAKFSIRPKGCGRFSFGSRLFGLLNLNKLNAIGYCLLCIGGITVAVCSTGLQKVGDVEVIVNSHNSRSRNNNRRRNQR